MRHLVVDSGAIIREVSLHELADNLWTVPEVITEIKDRRARHVLAALPQRLELREPSREAVNFVVNFSRRTGDFRAISDADVKVSESVNARASERVGGVGARSVGQGRRMRVCLVGLSVRSSLSFAVVKDEMLVG